MKQYSKILSASISLWIFFFSILSPVIGQTGKKTITRLISQSGVGGVSHNGTGYELGVQAVLKNKWSATLSYHSLNMKPANIPSDYKPAKGMLMILVIPIPYITHIKNIDLNLISLTGGRQFKLGRSIWATTEAGISLVKGEKVNFLPQVMMTEDYGLLGYETSSNYKTIINKKTTAGAMLRADINWAFTSFMGIGAGLYTNINSLQSFVGYEMKLFLGKTGREKKFHTAKKAKK